MADLLYDIKVDEPIIEMPSMKYDQTESIQVEDYYMTYDVPTPIITYVDREELTSKELQAFLDYQTELVDKYGDDWKNVASTDEKRNYINYYIDSHDVTKEGLLSKIR